MADRPFARILLKDGSAIDVNRDDQAVVSICHQDQCVNLPSASGQLTMELIALLEAMGRLVEFSEEQEE